MPKRAVFERSRRELTLDVSVGVHIILVVEQSSPESQSRGCAKTPILTHDVAQKLHMCHFRAIVGVGKERQAHMIRRYLIYSADHYQWRGCIRTYIKLYCIVLYTDKLCTAMQPMILPKRFDIFPAVWDAQKV